jgi:arylsulfatase A-like enzyme
MYISNWVVASMSALVLLAAIVSQYFYFIPGIANRIKYPIEPNREVVWSRGSASRNDTRPNIVVILVDDLGFNDISFFKGGFHKGVVQTPNIDSIGLSGVVFPNAYAGHATCAPSRASLLTGRFATKIGYEFTPVSNWGSWVIGEYMIQGPLKGVYHGNASKGLSYENMTLPLEAATIAEKLTDVGYKTLQLGKW